MKQIYHLHHVVISLSLIRIREKYQPFHEKKNLEERDKDPNCF